MTSESSDRGLLRVLLVRHTDADNNKEWGGIHITISGFDSKNQRKDVSKINFSKFSQENSNKFQLRPENGAKVVLWKGVWTIIFKSKRLNQFSNDLASLGFRNIKGPVFTRTVWHITLHGKNEKEAKDYLKYLVGKKKNFYLVLSEEKNGKFTYTKI